MANRMKAHSNTMMYLLRHDIYISINGKTLYQSPGVETVALMYNEMNNVMCRCWYHAEIKRILHCLWRIIQWSKYERKETVSEKGGRRTSQEF